MTRRVLTLQDVLDERAFQRFSRRPGARFNRGRVAVNTGEAATFVAPDGAVVITAPSASATLPINAARTITAYVGLDIAASVTGVEFYLDYPGSPLGSGTQISPTRWDISYTPELLDHGGHTLKAIADTGGGPVASADVLVSVSAAPMAGIWAAHGGAFFDARLLSGAVSSTVGNIPASEGSVDAVPANATSTIVIDQGGRKGITLANVNVQRFTVAKPHTGSQTPCTMVFRVRQTSGSKVLGGFGNSASAQDYVEVASTSGMVYRTLKDTLADSSSAVTGTADPDFLAHILVNRHDGTQFWQSMKIGSNPVVHHGPFAQAPAGTMTCNRFAFGAQPWSTNAAGIDGTLQCAGFLADYCMSQSEAEQLIDEIVASDLPAVVGAAVFPFGDSITKGDGAGGYRGHLNTYYVAQTLAIDLVGPFTYGTLADSQHGGSPGDRIAEGTTDIPAYFGTAGAFPSVQLAIVMFGTNDAVVPRTLLQMTDDLTALLNALDTQMTQTQAAARICFVIPPPIDPAVNAVASARMDDFAAAVDGVLDTFDAAHPTRTVFRASMYDAMGGTWSSTYMADYLHPNAAGYSLMWSDATYGIQQAIAAYLTTIG